MMSSELLGSASHVSLTKSKDPRTFLPYSNSKGENPVNACGSSRYVQMSIAIRLSGTLIIGRGISLAFVANSFPADVWHASQDLQYSETS